MAERIFEKSIFDDGLRSEIEYILWDMDRCLFDENDNAIPITPMLKKMPQRKYNVLIERILNGAVGTDSGQFYKELEDMVDYELNGHYHRGDLK